MRRLTQTPGYSISEERNEIKIESNSFRGSIGALEIRVPLRTNLELSSVNGGTITVENVEGELEIENVNGSVVLTNVAGSVVANSQNGGVTATLSRVMADKPMAFTSFNGKVDVTLPANIKANLKMRSDNGDIFTDFDVQLQQAPGGQSRQPQPQPQSQPERGLPLRGEQGGLRHRERRRPGDRAALVQRHHLSAQGAVVVGGAEAPPYLAAHPNALAKPGACAKRLLPRHSSS